MANIKLTANERQFVTAMNNSAGAVGRLSAELNIKLARSMRESEAISRQFAQGIGKIGDKLQSVGQSMSTYLTLPLTLAGGAALKAYGELDSLKKGLLSIEGTLPNVEKRLVELREAAKLPGLGFQEAIQGDVRLRSVGIAAETSLKILKEFGNANALTGGGKDKLSEIITQLSQMAAKGKVAAQDLKPIIEAAPSVSTAIKQMFGTVDSEGIQNKLTAMGKSSTDFINDLLGALEKTPRVAGGFKNAMENATDSLFVFAAGFGEAINKSFGVEEMLNGFSEKLAELTVWFQGLSPEVQKFILGLAGIMAIAGPTMIAVGGIVKAYAMLFTGTLALTAAISAIALAVGGLVYLWIDYQATQIKIANASKTLAQVETEVKTSIHAQAEEVRKHTDVLNDNNSTLAQRKTAIEALKQISPEYFGKLDSEKIKYDDLNVAVSKYITNLENAAKANLLKSQIDASVKAEQDIMNNPASATSDLKKIGLSYWENLVEPDTYDKAIKEQADRVVKKIRESREPIKKELEGLLKLGYKPTDGAGTGKGKGVGTGGGVSDGGLGAKLESTEKIIARVKKAYAEYLKQIQENRDVMGGLNLEQMQTGSGKDLDKMLNLERYTAKVASWSEQIAKSMANLKNSMPKIQFLPTTAQLSEEAARFQADLSAMIDSVKNDLLANSLAGLGEAFGRVLGGDSFNLKPLMAQGLNTIGTFMIEYGKKLLIAAKLFEGATAFFAANPLLGAGLMLIGGGIVKGLASQVNIPKFANGGIVYGPTMGLMGEYAGARNNPEVIAPLSKLKDMIGNTGGSVGRFESKLRGEDIYLALELFKKNKGK